jgi:spore maturation protein CgeB
MLAIQCSSRISLGLNWCAGGHGAGKDPQVKARIFEVAALGTFQLNYHDRRLARYFAPNEMATWSTTEDLINSIHFYLKHEKKREAIAARARNRCSMEHTWARRWKPLFAEIEEKNALLQR